MVLNCSGQLKNAFALACRRLLFPSLHRNFLSSLKLKNFNFFGKRWIFVRTERKFEEIYTIVRKFAHIAKPKPQNKFQSLG